MFLGPFFIYVHMLYNVSINQRRLFELGFKNKIDFNDGAILDVVAKWYGNPMADRIKYDNQFYVWIGHKLIQDQLPIMNLSKQKIYRKMEKFRKLGLFVLHPNSKQMGKSYYAATELFAAILSSTYIKNDDGTLQPTSKMMMGYIKNDDGPTSKMMYYNNTKDNSTNNNTLHKGNFAASQQNSLVGGPENFQEFEAEQNTTLNTKKEKTQDLEAGAVYFSDMPEILQDWTMEQDWDWLPKFKEQPKAKWLNQQLKDLGEETVKEIFSKIDAHCAKNTAYSSKRKSLSRVFAQFKKGAETAIIKEMKAVVSEEYQKVFQEDYYFAKTDGRKLAELAKKIKADLVAKFGNANPSDEEIVKGFKALMGALPEKYKDADQFKVALIEYNYQSIKNTIINGKSNRSKNKHFTVGKMPSYVPEGLGDTNEYGF